MDFLFPIGHKNLNKNIVSNLSQMSNVTVVAVEDYFDTQVKSFDGVTIINIKKNKEKKNIILSRLYALKNFLNTNKLLRWEDYDYIFINTFETITFAIVRRLIKNKRVFIVHHNNTDELNNKVKRFFFNRYKNQVHHIVFEDFIKEYLVDEVGVPHNRVHVIPHPLNYKEDISPDVDGKLCVGLSNSNDPLLISEIVKYENSANVFFGNHLKLILKSSYEHEDSKAIKILSGFIPKNDYSEYIKRSKFVLVPFKKSYNFRTSGVVIDALSNGKIVIGSNIPIVRSYAKRFPSICYTFDTVNGIPEILLNTGNQPGDKVRLEFENFKYEHSDTVIIEKLKALIGN